MAVYPRIHDLRQVGLAAILRKSGIFYLRVIFVFRLFSQV